MKRRTVMGLAMAGAAGLAAGGAVAFGGAASGGVRHRVMKRVAAAMLDGALDEARVTPEQRARLHEVRDRVFATLEAERAGRHAHLEAALRLFEADRPDPAALAALHEQGEAARARVRAAIHDAVVEAHGILTAEQRRAVAEYVRTHRLGHLH